MQRTQLFTGRATSDTQQAREHEGRLTAIGLPVASGSSSWRWPPSTVQSGQMCDVAARGGGHAAVMSSDLASCAAAVLSALPLARLGPAARRQLMSSACAAARAPHAPRGVAACASEVPRAACTFAHADRNGTERDVLGTAADSLTRAQRCRRLRRLPPDGGPAVIGTIRVGQFAAGSWQLPTSLRARGFNSAAGSDGGEQGRRSATAEPAGSGNSESAPGGNTAPAAEPTPEERSDGATAEEADMLNASAAPSSGTPEGKDPATAAADRDGRAHEQGEKVSHGTAYAASSSHSAAPSGGPGQPARQDDAPSGKAGQQRDAKIAADVKKHVRLLRDKLAAEVELTKEVTVKHLMAVLMYVLGMERVQDEEAFAKTLRETPDVLAEAWQALEMIVERSQAFNPPLVWTDFMSDVRPAPHPGRLLCHSLH